MNYVINYIFIEYFDSISAWIFKYKEVRILNYKLLKTFRKRHGFTQAEVAEYAGVSRQAFSNYERGLREPSIKVLIMLADLYHISLDELVGREQK